MLRYLLLAFVAVISIAMQITNAQNATKPTETEMEAFLDEFNRNYMEKCRRVTLASWNVATDIGNAAKEIEKEKMVLESAEFQKEWWTKHWNNVDLDDYKNESTKRQLTFLGKLGNAVLEKNELSLLTNTITQMSSIYNKATVCPFKQQNCSENSPDRLTLDPHITERFAVSRDFDELQYLWKQWHDVSGKLMRSQYHVYVELMNKVAIGNKFKDAAEYWKNDFETENFDQVIDKLWLDVKPLYDELHTYMRFKLIEIYGDKIDRSNPNIPAHLLGNMWAQDWQNLYDQTRPFKNATNINVTHKLKQLNYNALKMFETSDEFYTSLGLEPNRMSYTGESIIEKPKNRIVQCHASAWDFCDGKDFRIKMCTNINQEDLMVIHHEMGHIQYYQQYKHLPLTLRKGAHPGFHEAIGDTMALSVVNPRHLVKIGLLDNYNNTREDNINALYSKALGSVAFLPFGLLIDKWRWDVFKNEISDTEWNKHWWQLRETYQKVSSPVPRDEMDFDPGAKFHVPANSKYISYFFAHILEFQIYKSLCIEAGQYSVENSTKSLHECDFYRSKEAGRKLANGLKLGASKHWSAALKEITGESEMNASALLEYFKPLQDFLKTENQRLANEDEVRKNLARYNKEAAIMENKLKLADWDQITDLNNKTKEEYYSKIVAENAKFSKQQYELYFHDLKPDDFTDEKLRRQILYVTNLGTDALNETRLLNLTNAKAEMVKIYNNAMFCSYLKPNCTKDEMLTLDPEISDIMSKSNDYDELKYIWTMWHNSTGPSMKDYYENYIEISNEAAKLNGFADYGEMWRSKYEDPNFIENMEKIWKQIEPLYDQLHEYTRHKLFEIYGEQMNKSDPLIPAHLLGNMWAQSWVNLYERIKPFNTSDTDATESLQRNNYTALKIFQEADRFYKSLGLESNEMSYTGQSIIEKPKDRLIVCHASAWDFSDGKDFRIKQCTTVNYRNFITAHHEMGHIQYYILYKDQPLLFRSGANPGFHEAIGDVIALSASTPTHLKKINLLPDYSDTEEDNINALLKMALERIAFLPFGLLMDFYRYDLFNGTVPKRDWNVHWEKLREQYQKIRSPVARDTNHFDAGAKFHIPSDYQYSAYFFAHILEFQLLKSLCLAAEQYEPNNSNKPLHKCDIEGSIIAGNRLRDGLSLGLSKHWSETLSIMTNGEHELSADAILEYFKPLHEFLKKENERLRGDGFFQSKTPYVAGGFIILVCTIAIISYAIYHINRK